MYFITIFFLILLYVYLYYNNRPRKIYNFDITQEPFKSLLISNSDHVLIHSILRRIDLALGENNIEYILGFGSLLGAVRYENRMPWDDDVDLIVTEKDEDGLTQIDWMKYNLQISPIFFGYKIYDMKNSRKTDNERIFPFVDIFIYVREQNRWNFKSKRARKIWPVSNYKNTDLFPVKRCTYGDSLYPCPFNVDNVLTQTYGKTWKDKAYIKDAHVNKIGKEYIMPINNYTTDSIKKYLYYAEY